MQNSTFLKTLCCLSFILFFGTQSISQPEGPRLRDIGNQCLIGSRIHSGDSNNDIDGVLTDMSPGNVYTNTSAAEFNLGQTTWYPAWDGWNQNGIHNFAGVNGVINWSKDQDQTVMIHMLTGPDNYMPDWFKNNSWSVAEMDSLLKQMIYSIMDSNDNKNKVDVWNIMNEAFEQNGSYRTNMKWTGLGWEDDESGLTGTDQINIQHPVFIGKALTYARDKTDAILEIRDYLIENNNSSSGWARKHKAFYQLINHLLAKAYPLDAVGIQGHYQVGNTGWILPSLAPSIEKFRATGVEVYVTELDIASPNGWNATLEQTQRQDYFNVVRAAVDAGASMISLWGFRDTNDPWWLANEHPLVFEEDYTVKPAYYGVQEALMQTVPTEDLNFNETILLYPNPAYDYLIIEGINDSNSDINSIRIFDYTGKLLWEEKLAEDLNKKEIAIEFLPNGFYYLQLSSNSIIINKPFVKN